MDRILKLMENGVYYGEYDNTIPYSVAYETAQLRENMLNWFPFEGEKELPIYVMAMVQLFLFYVGHLEKCLCL